jgi:uncharacterized membrane protein YhhN
MQYLLYFHGNNSCTNAPKYYVYLYIVSLVVCNVLWDAVQEVSAPIPVSGWNKEQFHP